MIKLSEDNSQESIFSFHCMDPGGQIQVVRCGNECLNLLQVSLALIMTFTIAIYIIKLFILLSKIRLPVVTSQWWVKSKWIPVLLRPQNARLWARPGHCGFSYQFCISWRSVLNTTFPQSFKFDFTMPVGGALKVYFQVSILLMWPGKVLSVILYVALAVLELNL